MFKVRIILVAALVFVVTTGCVSKSEVLADHLPMYEGWCAYNIEVGAVSNTLEGCVQDSWNAGQAGDSKPLYKSFESMDKMNEYIAFESGLRMYCRLMKDSPTEYEQLMGLTRVGELTYEQCKRQIIDLNMITTVLESVPYDLSRSRGWVYEPGVTYRINGDVYNDPFGLDYKNGPSDSFGDGK